MRSKKKVAEKIPDDTDELYKTVAKWVENRGGKLVVVGGVEVQKWPRDNEFVFKVAVKCTGKQPQNREADAKQ